MIPDRITDYLPQDSDGGLNAAKDTIRRFDEALNPHARHRTQIEIEKVTNIWKYQGRRDHAKLSTARVAKAASLPRTVEPYTEMAENTAPYPVNALQVGAPMKAMRWNEISETQNQWLVTTGDDFLGVISAPSTFDPASPGNVTDTWIPSTIHLGSTAAYIINWLQTPEYSFTPIFGLGVWESIFSSAGPRQPSVTLANVLTPSVRAPKVFVPSVKVPNVLLPSVTVTSAVPPLVSSPLALRPPSPVRVDVIGAIDEIMEVLGASQGAVAAALGVSASSIENWRNGIVPRPSRAARALALRSLLRALQRSLGSERFATWLAAGMPSWRDRLLGGDIPSAQRFAEELIFKPLPQSREGFRTEADLPAVPRRAAASPPIVRRPIKVVARPNDR